MSRLHPLLLNPQRPIGVQTSLRSEVSGPQAAPWQVALALSFQIAGTTRAATALRRAAHKMIGETHATAEQMRDAARRSVSILHDIADRPQAVQLVTLLGALRELLVDAPDAAMPLDIVLKEALVHYEVPMTGEVVADVAAILAKRLPQSTG